MKKPPSGACGVHANPLVVIAPAMFFDLHNMMFHRAGVLEFDSYFEAHVQLVLNGVLGATSGEGDAKGGEAE